MGSNRAVHIRLPDGRAVVVYPTVGVPTSTTLHEASTNSPDQSVAVVYDHVGLHPRWLGHLDWLGSKTSIPRDGSSRARRVGNLQIGRLEHECHLPFGQRAACWPRHLS